MPRAFISHTRKDDDYVTALSKQIIANGIEIWADHLGGVNPSDDMAEAIQRGLNECNMTLVVLSNVSARKTDVRNECLQTRRLGKRLYVALIEEIDPKNFPWFLNVIAYVDLSIDPEGGFNELIRAMHANSGLDLANEQVNVKRRLTSCGAIDPRLFVDLIGRDDDLIKVESLLNTGRPTFITGFGGIGKSRLAYELALRFTDVDGVIWHVCSDSSSPESLFELLQEHMQLPLHFTTAMLLDQVKAQRFLVVLDNAEAVQDEGRRISYIETANKLSESGIKVLLTSREIWPEFDLTREFAPQQLPVESAAVVCGEMSKFDDIFLTEEQTKVLVVKTFMHPRLIEFAVRLCKRRDFSRVIETLNALQGRSIEEALNEMILQTVEQMKQSDPDYGQLAVKTLKRLNVCRGGFTYDAAKRFTVDSDSIFSDKNVFDLDEILDLLQQWNFIRRDRERKRFMIDSLLIAVVGEDIDAFDLHFNYYKDLAFEHSQREEYLRLEPDAENLSIAFERKLSGNQLKDALRIWRACTRFLANRLRLHELDDWLMRLKPKVESSENTWLKAQLKISLGDMYAHRKLGNRASNLEVALSLYLESLENFGGEPYIVTRVSLYNNLGHAYWMLSELENEESNLVSAIEAYRASLASFNEHVKYVDYGATWGNLGIALERLGDLKGDVQTIRDAVDVFNTALKLSSPDRTPLSYGNILNNYGNGLLTLAKREGRKEGMMKALSTYQLSLEYHTKEKSPQAYAMACLNVGSVYLELSLIEDTSLNEHKAIQAFEEALSSCPKEVDPLQRAMTLLALGVAWRIQGDVGSAVNCWEEAVPLFQQVGDIRNANLLRQWISHPEQSNLDML